MAEADFYTMPEHGWTCFHCGETFTTPGGARDHFGFDPSQDPACRIKLGDERGLVRELRSVQAKYEKLLQDTCDENGKVAQEFYGLGSKHAREVMRAEEQGYERGLRDYHKAYEAVSLLLTAIDMQADLAPFEAEVRAVMGIAQPSEPSS